MAGYCPVILSRRFSSKNIAGLESVATSSTNGLVATRFESRYWLHSKACNLKAQWEGVRLLHPPLSLTKTINLNGCLRRPKKLTCA